MRRWRIGPRWTLGTAAVTTPNTPMIDTIDVVTAAARIINAEAMRASGNMRIVPHNDSWQLELWDYYENTGEYGLAVSWRANMISRVRLRAARLQPDADEPMIVDSGPGVDLLNELFDDTGSQGELLSSLSVLLDVPGEGWLIGEKRDGREVWRTYSSDEFRRRGDRFEVIDEISINDRVKWRVLPTDSLIVRIWRPHRRLRHQAHSPGKAARTALRELNLVNRHIQAQYLSRLASAGIVVLPDEVAFPVRPEFQGAPDPFVAEWLESAKQAIEKPGTASAVIPIPMRIPGEYVDKVRHIDFTMKIDEKIIEKRDSARKQLASQINVPTELLFDAGDLNHWGLWQLEESAVKAYITPDVELIAGCLTVGYLRPRLRARDEDPRDWVVWYDASEIITRPDRSENVVQAYDRFEITGKALRREIGLNEDDAPVGTELSDVILKKLSANPQVGLLALDQLTGVHVSLPDVETRDRDTDDDDNNDDNESPADGPPDTRTNTPPREPRETKEASRDAFVILQAQSQHVLEFGVGGTRLKHPLLCQPKLFSCPFTHVTYAGVAVHPGTYGDYECYLSSTGELVIGRRTFPRGDEYIPTSPWRIDDTSIPATNGHRT